MRPPVQEAPPRRSPPTLTRSHQQNHQTVHHTPEQGTTSNRKTRKRKSVRRTPQFPTSLSTQPQRQVSRPCCTACALAVNAQTTNIPQRPLATTRLPLPRTINTLPSKPLPDNKNAGSKLCRLEFKIPRVSYPTQQPTASTTPLPPRVARVTQAGDVPPSSHNAAGKCSFLHGATGIRNSLNRKKTQILSAALAPFPSFETNMSLPLRARYISPAGNVLDTARAAPLLPPYFRRKSPCPLGILPPPTHAKCMSHAQARSRSPVSSPVAIVTPSPSEYKTWCHRVFTEDTTQRRTRTRIKQNSVPISDALTSSSTIPIYQENELQIEYDRPLFAKDLIDLLGDKNDERLRVLYKNPAREQPYPSEMRLVGSRNKRRKTAPKKMPWR